MQDFGIEVKCGNCGHTWTTKSKRRYTTCPQCLYKVPVKRPEGVPGRLDTRALENWLWQAACSIRGAVDAPKFKDYILPLVFAKRLSDVFEDEMSKLADQFGDEFTALELVEKDHGLVRFHIPKEAKWDSIRNLTVKVGEGITDAMRAVAKENPKLQGVIDVVDFNVTYAGTRVIDDTRLQALIEALSDPRYRLGLDDVEPDILGRAYEYLIRKFAEGQGQSAGEFFTPKEVSWTIAHLVNPEQGDSVCDPACGSGGLLIKCQLLVQQRYAKVERPLQLFGQEVNHVTYAMSRMNMIIHDMEGDVAIGDTLRNPKFLDGGELKKFRIVVANPMWMQKGYNGGFYENDPYGRFEAGYPPPGSADWGWVQHMVSSLDDNGRAAVVLDPGAVSRGSGGEGTSREKDIRTRFVKNDSLAGVILLPENLFYNTPAQGIILLLDKAKSASRRGQIMLVNASLEFEKGMPKNFIPDASIKKIADAYGKWEAIPNLSKIVTIEEIEQNDFNLNPSKYISVGPATEVKPLLTVIENLHSATANEKEAESALAKALRMVGVDE